MKLAAFAKLQRFLNNGVPPSKQETKHIPARVLSYDHIFYGEADDGSGKPFENHGESEKMSEGFRRELGIMYSYTLVDRRYLLETLNSMNSDLVAISAVECQPVKVRGLVGDKEETVQLFAAIAPVIPNETPDLFDPETYRK